MGFFKKLFGSGEKFTVTDHNSFWQWLSQNGKYFYRTINSRDSQKANDNFLEKLDITYEIIKDKYWAVMNRFQ